MQTGCYYSFCLKIRFHEGAPNRHPRGLLIGDLSPNIQVLPLEGKDARLLPRA